MAKKRGKPKQKLSSVKLKKAKAQKKPSEKIPEEKKPLNDTLRELEILAEEKKVGDKVESIEKKEEAIEKKEEAIAKEEKKIEKEAGRVEELEKEIKREVTTKPLAKLGIKDLNKGIIGAFVGVVAHYAFIYGKEIAKNISTTRAVFLLAFSYLLILILMYETGYREIKEKRLLGILPKRATAIYLTSLMVVFVIFFLFNLIDLSNPMGLFKEIAVTSVLASVGAGTADLIGRG